MHTHPYPVGCTAERFFRVDRAQENLHCITDIATDCRLFLLDQDGSRPAQQQTLPVPPPPPPTPPQPLSNAGSTDTEPAPGSSGASPCYKYPTLNRSLSGPPGSESFSFPTVRLLARKSKYSGRPGCARLPAPLIARSLVRHSADSQEAVGCCVHQQSGQHGDGAGRPVPRAPSVQLQPPR